LLGYYANLLSDFVNFADKTEFVDTDDAQMDLLHFVAVFESAGILWTVCLLGDL